MVLQLKNHLKLWSLPLALILTAKTEAIASAQVFPDNTLPQNSIVAPNGDIIKITGGTIEGNNLFHSFEQFSVLKEQTAFFDNTSAIANIIGRVTGSFVSEIDGLISANGTANLFLLNPNGIIFGQNAALDIGGSFIGSTADSIKFADGVEFSAVNPNATPLLTVSIPIGLQYGGQNGDITVKGSGNNLFIDFDTFTVDRNERPIGLAVQPEKTLALVGSNVFIEGGNLTAPEGNIELGSVAGEGTVKLTTDALGLKLGYEEVSGFQDIGLSQAASLEASGNSGGRVRLKGDFVTLTDGSAILTDTLGDGSGGSLTIEASETEIYGIAENGFTSSLFTNVDLGATGDAGDLLIDTGYLYVGEGAQVNVNTFGLGNAGTLTVKANEIELLGGSVDGEFPSGLFAQADIGETGKGGNIYIEADYLLVADGAQISTTTFGAGDAGTLTVKASEIELIAGAKEFGSSGFFASSEDIGKGGNLNIEADSLYIADGAQVVTSSFWDGDAGNLTVKASEIELIGTSPNGISSGLFANADFDSIGKGGNLDIEADSLYIADGARAIAATFGAGDAGDLTVKASEIELIGTSVEGNSSGLFSTVEEGATGNGGNLSITTQQLLVSEGSQIAVSTAGSGTGGILDIEADNVELIGSGKLVSSGLFSNAIIGDGDGGDINLKSDRLTILDGATISAGNFSSINPDIPPGTGKAGNIEIEVNSLKLDRAASEIPSNITASTNTGGGGEITLNVTESITLSNNSQIAAETQGSGDGGKVNLSANSLELNTGGLITTSTEASGDAGRVEIQADNITLTGLNSAIKSEVEDTATGDGGNIAIITKNFNLNNQAQVSANSSGLGQAGNIEISANDEINTNQGKITATSTQTGGGDINLVTDFLFLENNSLISTSVLDSTSGGGNLTIDSNYIIAQDNSDLRANAVLGQGGNIDITTEVFLLSLDSDVDASSEFGLDGVVEIKSPDSDEQIRIVSISETISDPTGLITSACPVEQGNVMVVAGKGGLAENPSQVLRSESVWEDLRDFSASPEMAQNTSREKIIEANGWTINDKGNIELLSHVPASFNNCRQIQ